MGHESDTGHEKSQNKKPSNIQWHPAFIEAIKLELEDYRDSLEFLTEYNLTTAPLRIDCIIIKKDPAAVIKKNIAAIFREVNLVEYKSPDDYLSVADFYKVYSYAYLYASLANIPITSLSISFITDHLPEKLFMYLKDVHKYQIAEKNMGIYTVTGDIMPIQVIQSRRLTVDENLWLRNLSNNLDAAAFIRIGKETKLGERAAKAYLDVITRANAKMIREVWNMSDAEPTLEEVLEEVGLTAKWEAIGEARGEARSEAKWKQSKALEIARNMVNLGLSEDTIIAATGLEPETVNQLHKK